MAKTSEWNLEDVLKGIGERVAQSASLPNLTRYKPHPKQEQFHCSAKKGRLFIGGNRTGKTVSNVVECCWWITKTHPWREMPQEPVRGRLTCVDFLNGLDKIILPLFKQWLPTKYLINNNWDESYDKEHKTLTMADGSFIEFMSYDQDLDKFAGTSRHFVSFDEEPPKNIFEECKARLVDVGGSWWMSMTPVDGMTWIYDDIFEPNVNNPEGRIFIIQADMLDNPYISEEDAEEYLSGLSPEVRKIREKGEFVQRGGLVYKRFMPTIHRVDYAFVLRPDMRIYTSVDIGWNHPTAWLWHAVEPNGHITTFHEMVASEINIRDWSKRVLDYEREMRNSYPFFTIYLRCGDPAMRQTRANTGVSDLMEFAAHGIYIGVEGIPTGPGSVHIGLSRMDQYLEIDPDPREQGRPYWQYTANCTTLEKQMLRLRWETWASKKMQYENAPKETIHKKDDDAPDSLRYFICLQPELKFKTEKPEREINNWINAVPPASDFDYNRLVPATSSSSQYAVSNWDMEN